MTDEILFEQCFDEVFDELVGTVPSRANCLAACIKSRDGDARRAMQALRPLFFGCDIGWPRYESQVESEPDEDGELTRDIRGMADAFVHYVTILFYGRRRFRQMREAGDAFPYWLLVPHNAPPECEREGNIARHFTDPFWAQHAVPCGRIYCGCRIRALMTSEAIKFGAERQTMSPR